jgi:RNA polymerase sigma-70 factor (ECF subfamily)
MMRAMHPPPRAPPPAMADAFRAHQRFVWGIAYRMTGSASDADDVVQTTFARAVERPPRRLDQPLRPWLTRVAINASKDALRARRRRGYVGPWLPSPIETDPDDLSDAGRPGTDARYDAREAASFAFLIALEALTPQQRAVLILRDVFDYSVEESAAALGLSSSNVKVIHHRARRAMLVYDRDRRPPSAELGDQMRRALERFLGAIVAEDAAAAEACLTDDVRALSDGGGEYLAALQPVKGKDRVVRFLIGIQRKVSSGGRFAPRIVNGLPAVVAEMFAPRERFAPRFVIRCEVNADGSIREVHLVVASRKLSAVAPIWQENSPE